MDENPIEDLLNGVHSVIKMYAYVREFNRLIKEDETQRKYTTPANAERWQDHEAVLESILSNIIDEVNRYVDMKDDMQETIMNDARHVVSSSGMEQEAVLAATRVLFEASISMLSKQADD